MREIMKKQARTRYSIEYKQSTFRKTTSVLGCVPRSLCEKTATRFVCSYSPVIAINTILSSASSSLSSSKLNDRAFLSSRTRQTSVECNRKDI